MKLIDTIKYRLTVDVAGRAFLRYERFLNARRLKNARFKSENLAPPLRISAWTKELISLHYFRGRYVEGHQPVAYVTSGGPVEILKALGYYVIYPENHAALAGARHAQMELIQSAEEFGFSQDICSYVRTDLGTALTGKTPVGKLPKPDLLLACTNICQTVLHWYRVLQKIFNVPLVVIDTPFVYTEAPPHAVEYVKKQLENELIPVAERVAGRTLKEKKFKEVVKYSKDATELWLEILNMGRHIPTPISIFDQFIHMAPIVEMRGDKVTVDFYYAMLKEVKERVKKGIGSVKNEKKRVLWDNLPVWYKLSRLAAELADRGVSMPISTYTYAWGELAPLIDIERGMESMARVYLYPILNRGTGHKLEVMRQMVKDFKLDGVILHSDRSCKPYSIGQVPQRNKLMEEFGIPALLLEADHNDERAFSEEQVASRIASFLEMMEVA